MAKTKTCSKCAEPRVDGQSLCAEHYAEYMREYRSLAEKKRGREQEHRGFEEGVRAAIEFLRTSIGDQTTTGLRAAILLDRSCLAQDQYAIVERRRLINSISPFR